MDFPTGTTGVLVNGKAIPLAEYLASQGEAVKTTAPPDRVFFSDVTEKAGVSHLTDVLAQKFRYVKDIRDASIDQLTAVDGVGEKTAKKLKAAAEELLS